MKTKKKMKYSPLLGITMAAWVLMSVVATQANAGGTLWFSPNWVQVGQDNNSANNPFVQPQDPALAGGGRDQSLQFGDVLFGSRRDDLQIGGLGTDILAGGSGSDVMIGGLEHFNPFNRDRAFGGNGKDIFIWKPGDGSDLFDGGKGADVVIFGVVGENNGGFPEFAVLNDQQAGEVFIDPVSGLPEVNVSGSPGFCEVIDESTSADAADELRALGLNHLVRFSLRGIRNSFEAGEQSEDNGLRVTLHLRSVETLVCTNRDGGRIEILDLTQSPPVEIDIADIASAKIRARLQSMLF